MIKLWHGWTKKKQVLLTTMFFKGWRLPKDNVPDATETRAFQQYRGRHSFGFSLNLQQFFVLGVLLGAVIFIGIGVYFLLPEAEPAFRVVPNGNIILPEPTTDPLRNVPTVLPETISDRLGIRIPARIDNTMQPYGSRLYAFYAEAGLTWNITITASQGFAPTVNIYDPRGAIVANSLGNQEANLVIPIIEEGTYTLLIEDTFGRGGRYTLWVLPGT